MIIRKIISNKKQSKANNNSQSDSYVNIVFDFVSLEKRVQHLENKVDRINRKANSG